MALIGFWDNYLFRTILAVLIGIILIVYWSWCCRCAENKVYRTVYGLVLLGACANFTVIFANGGYMPAVSQLHYDGSIWIPMTDVTVYNWLGDRFAGFSIGDFSLSAGLLLMVVYSLIKKAKKQRLILIRR